MLNHFNSNIDTDSLDPYNSLLCSLPCVWLAVAPARHCVLYCSYILWCIELGRWNATYQNSWPKIHDSTLSVEYWYRVAKTNQSRILIWIPLDPKPPRLVGQPIIKSHAHIFMLSFAHRHNLEQPILTQGTWSCEAATLSTASPKPTYQYSRE